MSGGVYNYISHKDNADLIYYTETLMEIVKRLSQMGCELEARQTLGVVRTIEKFEKEMNERATETLRDVWFCLDRIDSCDYGEEDIVRFIDKNRENKGKL